MPVTYLCQLMSVAYGKDSEEAGLDGQVIAVKQLEDIVSKILRFIFIKKAP